MRFPGFIGPSYKLTSVNVDCQRCINLYPEVIESGRGKDAEIAALVSTPGLRLLATIGSGPIRGQYYSSTGKHYVVSANKLYSVSSAWVATELGTLSTNSGYISFADNGTSCVLVDGQYGYSVTMSSGAFAQISDPDFMTPKMVTYQDGYFIFIRANSGQFFISNLNDVTFDAADVATSEGNPDLLVACISDHRDLWMFNEKSIEVFYNSGNADFPFERLQGSFVEHGCAASFSVAKINNTVFWLGQDDKGTGIVYSATGYQPQRISTHAVETAIQGYSDISSAVAYTYQQNGHSFYVLNFPSASTTWVYDASTNLWHERCYLTNGSLTRHRANNYSFAHSTHVVGDWINGKIYELDADTYTDNGDPIQRKRITPHLSSSMKRLFYASLQLDVEAGTGLDGTGQGTDPQIMLRYSNDNGHTWSSEKWTALGKIGQKKQRAIWRRLGSGRDRVFEITITDPNKVVFLGAEIDVVAGAS